MIHNVSRQSLAFLQLDEHIQNMEEWNEEHNFTWPEASLFQTEEQTIVLQDDGAGCLHVAVYARMSDNSNDLIALRVYGGKGPIHEHGHEYMYH